MSALPPRSTPAQQAPPASMVGLPTTRPSGVHWYREHGERVGNSDRGCWYYASLPADPATGGRFDVSAPEGTCYFANSALVAAMERCGRFIAQHSSVPADLVEDRVVSTIETNTMPAQVVDLLAVTASTRFGVTGELFTMPDYSVPQAWAAAIRREGHQALVYTPRFSPSGQAIAVFGPGGPHPRATTSAQALRQVLLAGGVRIEPIPPVSALRIVVPPGS